MGVADHGLDDQKTVYSFFLHLWCPWLPYLGNVYNASNCTLLMVLTAGAVFKSRPNHTSE